MSLNRVILLCFFSFMLHPILRAEDGYRLWMRYEVIPAGALRDSYIEYLVKIDYENEEISPQLSVAISELDRGVSGLMGGGFGSNVRPILIGTPEKNREIDGLGWESECSRNHHPLAGLFGSRSADNRHFVRRRLN